MAKKKVDGTEETDETLVDDDTLEEEPKPVSKKTTEEPPTTTHTSVPTSLEEALKQLQDARNQLTIVNHESASRRVALKEKDDAFQTKLQEISTLTTAVDQLKKQRADDKLKAAVTEKAVGLKFREPSDAIAFLNLTLFKVKDDGTIEGDIEAELKKIAEKKPYLTTNGRKAADLDQHEQNVDTSGALSNEAELRSRFRMS